METFKILAVWWLDMPSIQCTKIKRRLYPKGGLNRWTTEENLSFDGGSREDKMDTLALDGGPMTGTLNDCSHSNSTDSGIQSVGDSIRGSSDSVTANKEIAASGHG